jgi:hypothetical protein
MANFSASEMAAIVAQQSRLAAVSARAMLRSAWQSRRHPNSHNGADAPPKAHAAPDFSEQFLSLAVAELKKYNRATLVDGAAKLVLLSLSSEIACCVCICD